MKIVIFLWSVVILIEVGFLIRAFVTKQRQDAQKEVARIGEVVLLLLLLTVGILDGFSRYGLFVGILSLQVAINGIRILRKKEKPFKKGRMIGALIGNGVLYAVSLTSAIMFPQYEQPIVTGNHEILISEYTWEDENRVETFTDTGENRSVTVKFWYPEEEGTYPLIVFSHGAFGVIDSNYSTCMELASNGYVVASIAHPYHAMFVEETDGDVITVSQDFMNETTKRYELEEEHIVYNNGLAWMDVRRGDANFVLDTILGKVETSHKELGEKGAEGTTVDATATKEISVEQMSERDLEELELFAKINPEKIGMFGHSMGGATAVAMGRERDEIDAVIDLEGTMLGEYVDFEDGWEVYNAEPYPVPLLDVNSRVVDTEAHSYADYGLEYVNFYVGRNALDYEYAIIEDAGHLNFTDLPMVSPILAKMLGAGSIDPKECIEEINAMVLDFFDKKLKDGV